MATYTVTTGTPAAPTDYAGLGLRVNGDVFNINGGYLRVDCDSRYGLNGAAAAAFGNITLSATLGGSIEFNSTKVRLIPFSSGTGTVPAADTVIGTAGGASGKLIGVYSALNVAPTAAAAAMPASGYIKVRQWNGTTYAASTALTGISATTSDVDGPGWLECVGVDAGTATINRLNSFIVRGDYYTFQGVTTTGTRTSTYQLPTNGSAVVYVPGVEVETGVGTGVYEFYPCAGTRTALAANIATDAVRGRWCWVAAATGLVTFGYDGTNSTGGYVPVAGCRIRVPNIFFTCCVAATSENVIPNATLATRYEFAVNGGGVLDMDKVCCNWYLNLNQPYSIALNNVSTFESVVLTECASPISWTNVGVGQTAANTQIALIMSLNFAGGSMTDCTWSRAAQAATGTYVCSWADCSGFTVVDERIHSLTKAANATSGSQTQTRVASSSWTNTTLGGGRVFMTTCVDVVFTNTVYYDNPSLTTGTAIPMYAFDIGTACLRCKFDGLDWGGLLLVQPYSGVLNIGAAGCTDIKVRNLGTAASPLDMGDAYVDATWSRTTVTMTVTKVGHKLKANDVIAVNVVSDVAPKAVTTTTATLWTVASAPTADTFTVTVTNAGGASGTLSYYPCMAGVLVNIANGAAANNVKIQRCYVPHLRTGLLVGDNSSKNILMESTWGTEWGVQLVPELNALCRSIQASPALTAQTSTYGTHFFDYFTCGDPPNKENVAWSRTTTTATITSASHTLRTGLQIVVTVTSDSAAIVKGIKTITATTSGAFTFTCLNAGGASGTLTYEVLNSRIAIEMNEPTADTVNQVTLANGAAFTSAGGLYMPVIGQQADFTYPANVIGYTGFPIAEAVMAGGTIGNYDITYSLDGGASYHNLYYARAGGGGTSGQTNVTMTNTTGVEAGDYVFGTNIAQNAKVNSVTDGTTIVVDTANVGTVSGVLRFNHLPSETVPDASVGFPLKVRIKTTTTNATAITSLLMYARSTLASRAYTFPLDTLTLTLTGLVSGSDIVILNAGTTTERINVDANVGTTYNYVYSTLGNIDIGVFKAGYVPLYIRNYALSSSNATLPVAQSIDRAYA